MEMWQINKNEIYNMIAETGWNITVEDRNRIKNYIKYQLWIPLINWGIRAIYIKLFLEGKINEEEFRELVLSRDIEINLFELLPEDYWEPYGDYVFINNLR